MQPILVLQFLKTSAAGIDYWEDIATGSTDPKWIQPNLDHWVSHIPAGTTWRVIERTDKVFLDPTLA